MSFLHRVSTSFWSYLSPPKTSTTERRTSRQHTQDFTKIFARHRPFNSNMSSPSGRPGDKRKRDDSPFSPAQPSKKKGKKDEDAEMSSENEYEPAGGQQQDQQSDLTGAMNRIGLRSTPPTSSLGEEEDVEMEEEETSEQEQSGESEQSPLLPALEADSDEWLRDIYRLYEHEEDDAMVDVVPANNESQSAEDEYPLNLPGWDDDS